MERFAGMDRLRVELHLRPSHAEAGADVGHDPGRAGNLEIIEQVEHQADSLLLAAQIGRAATARRAAPKPVILLMSFQR